MNRSISTLIISLMIVMSIPATVSGAPIGGPTGPVAATGPEFVEGEVLVKFKDSAATHLTDALKGAAGVAASEPLPYADFERLRLNGTGVEEALSRLRSSGLVEYAEPNYIRRITFTPNDPLFGDQWNFNQPTSGGGINMPAAWDIEKGGDSSVIVAVLDTGVAYENRGIYKKAPDLMQTTFIHGYDFINNDKYANDDNGHGTHVCGTIAQSTDTPPPDGPYGCAGIAYESTVMPVKVIDADGVGTDEEIVQGIRYAADNGAEIINMSLAGPGRSEILEEAVEYAASKGVIICASTGNDDSEVGYPAGYSECIAVGATTKLGKRASYSNYGSALDVVAPGGNAANGILQETIIDGNPSDFDWVEIQGTSMASPHAAGVCALLKAKHPSWNATDIRGALASTCLDLGSPGWDPQYGFGLIDAAAALQAPKLPTPVLGSYSPDFGQSGSSISGITITGSDFTSPIRVMLERERGLESGLLPFFSQESTEIFCIDATDIQRSGSTKLICKFDLSNAQSGLWNLRIENPAGKADGVEGGFMVDPADNKHWYLAEGSTAYGFEEFILIQNPGDVDTTAVITFMTPAGAENPYPIAVPAKSRSTLRVNDVLPDTDVSAEITADQDIICERSMYWGDRIEGTDCIGVQSRSYNWYLAEGTTAYGFDTFLLIQNPSPTDALVKVTYMTPEGPVEKDEFEIGADSRYTINVRDDLPESDVSLKVQASEQVIVERSMYWDGMRGGHVAAGTNSPAGTWYLAEGSTDWGFEEYVLLQNPGEDEVTVDLTYMTPEGPVPQPEMSLAAGSRVTVRVNDALPDRDVSVKVTADTGIIAERAMYWNNGTGKGGHDALGVTQPRQECFLAEGSTDWGFDEWVLIQNPNDTEAGISIQYNTSSGLRTRPGFGIPPNSRVTVHVNADVPDIDTSTYIYSDKRIISERAMYWNNRGGGHVSQGLMR